MITAFNTRLVKGFSRFFGTLGFVFLFQYHEWDKLIDKLSLFLKPFLGELFTGLVILVFFLFTLFLFFKFLIGGAYYMLTWQWSGTNVQEGGIRIYGNSNYPNLNRVLNYRESIMKSMTNEQASRFYIETSKLDNLYSGQHGARTMQVVNYLEGRLDGMNNQQAMDYLRGKDC